MEKKKKKRQRRNHPENYFLKPSFESQIKASSSIHRIVHDSFQFLRHFFIMFYKSMYGNQRKIKKKKV